MFRAQLAPAASVAGQLLLCIKSLALAPAIAMPLTVTLPLPALVRVTVCGIDVVPTTCGLKLMLEGESETVEPEPFPPDEEPALPPPQLASINANAQMDHARAHRK